MNVYADLLKKKKERKLKRAKRRAKALRLGLPDGRHTLRGRRDKADTLFKRWVRERDNHTCQRCGSREFPQASHFWSCGIFGTRYDPLNVDCLCATCHFDWETKKQGPYRDWKIKQLGEEGYLALRERSESEIKLQRAVDEFFAWFEKEVTSQVIG